MSVTTVRLQAEVEQHLEAIAGRLYRSKDWVINQALSEYIEKQQREQERWQQTLEAMESAAHGEVVDSSPSAAGMIAAELISKIELLPDFPKMGTPVEMAPAPDSIRDMVFGKYVVRYSVHTSVIIILRVWHGLEGER